MRSIRKIVMVVLFSSIFSIISNAKLTSEEKAEKVCQVVNKYMEFKKYVGNVTNEELVPRLRHASSIALEKLLDHEFNITENFGGKSKNYNKWEYSKNTLASY